MLLIRLYSISHPPLNYTTYLSRISILPKIFESSTPLIKQQLLLDLIKANRTLQQTPSIPRVPGIDLGISRPSNTKLESNLKQLLFHKFRTDSINDIKVIREYLLYEPKPNNVQDLIEVTSDFFQHQLTHNQQIDTSLVYLTLGRILDQNDYFNGFDLIDKTVNSETYLDYRKTKLMKPIVFALITNMTLLTIQTIFLDQIPVISWMSYNLITTYIITSVFTIRNISSIGRLKFRFYNSKLYNYLHKHELITINKIITHLEEHNETNVNNFHYSQVRPTPNLNQIRMNDYIIEIPDVVRNAHPWTHLPNEQIIEIQKFFRSELNKRRIMLGDVEQELLFIEYWKNHGEGFTWCEPDQDPGEIIKLKIEN